MRIFGVDVAILIKKGVYFTVIVCDNTEINEIDDVGVEVNKVHD